MAQTAAALRIREGTVKSRLSRATKVLATELDHLRPEPPPMTTALDAGPDRRPFLGRDVAALTDDEEQP